MTYTIEYYTGAIRYASSLDSALEIAEDGMAYTQASVDILCDGKVVAHSQWVGLPPEDDDDVLCRFGDWGFYRAWEFD